MWPPLLCPSFSRAVTACWHDLEYNHRVVMTQRWILGWPAEPPPAATQHDVALCPCLLFFLYVHLFGCVCACVNASACGREGVAHSTDTIRKQLLGDLHIGQSVSQSADDEMQIATESETVKCKRVLCMHMWRHLHEPEEAVYICILHPEGWKMTCLLWLYLR